MNCHLYCINREPIKSFGNNGHFTFATVARSTSQTLPSTVYLQAVVCISIELFAITLNILKVKMVLAERNSENVRNGRRSRGPSPNGQTESSSEEDGVPAEKIRVGRDFQVIVPEFVPINERRLDQCPDRALLVWSPTTDIPDQKLDEYIILAKEKYGYNERAVLDLANFTPFPDEWTVEDKVLFEQAFQFHGKSFHRIRQMLPDKSIASLVKYYYSWKKTRTRTSLMDRQARKLTSGGKEGENGSENGSELGSNTDSESEEKKWTIHRGIRRGKNQAVPGSQSTDAKAPSDSENAPQVQVLSLNLTLLS
ncbi:REST corepressor 3-like isoform X1 [Vespula maculifrons]|uniref:REST corepressor 3-like isoform X1 n=1 Tax=Vespula maculifrons TaxID=7453 RepID=A0ABD2B0P1_VESMC